LDARVQVYSAYRLVEACKRAGGRVVLVNCGPTRADSVADLKLQVLAGEAMMRAATHTRLLLPRPLTA
jgi:NAD-dependent deacetylase sirtuin 4